MNKYEQFRKEYDALHRKARPYLKDDPNGFEFYIQRVLLRVWGANGRYAEDYAKTIQAITGKTRSPEDILKAMIRCRDEGPVASVPAFYEAMVVEDFAKSTGKTKAFVEGFKLLIVGGACINGDFTVEESNALSAEIKNLMNFALSKGVKVSYSSARIREKTTPLNEESYRREDLADGGLSGSAADLIFKMTDESFLNPAQMKRDEIRGEGPSSAGGSGGSAGGSGSAGENPFAEGSGQTPPAQQAAGPEMAASIPATVDERTMEELMAELDGLVGLESIKRDIHSLMNFIRITKLREERGLTVPTISYHLVFTGNPGTGKTTVARLVAGLYRRIGILPKGQLVEVDRGALVAGYTGQTAIKTTEVINRALGGVLFIDEAYALVNDDQDSFGKEAVETLLKAMEDHRDELVVIVAGYTELMHKFIESNPGFKSRFSKFFEFPDYTGEELMEIFRRFAENNGYTLAEDAEKMLKEKLNEMYENRSRHFGNGRTVRNIFEKAIHRQADRLSTEGEAPKTEKPLDGVTDQDLTLLTAEDLESALAEEAKKDQLTVN